MKARNPKEPDYDHSTQIKPWRSNVQVGDRHGKTNDDEAMIRHDDDPKFDWRYSRKASDAPDKFGKNEIVVRPGNHIQQSRKPEESRSSARARALEAISPRKAASMRSQNTGTPSQKAAHAANQSAQAKDKREKADERKKK